MEAAVAKTGLSDFGDDGFHEPLDLLCTAFCTEAGLSGPGVVSDHAARPAAARTGCSSRTCSRRHPEIHDVRIEAPIIIVGLPRTGTTHLHNLIAADPALRSLPYWESLEPVLPRVRATGAGRARPAHRPHRGRARLRQRGRCRYFKRMHEMTVDHVHEEIQLLAIDFSTMLFETIAADADLARLLPRPRPDAALRVPEDGAQVLQSLRGGERWVLKSPQHLEQFRPLLATCSPTRRSSSPTATRCR